MQLFPFSIVRYKEVSVVSRHLYRTLYVWKNPDQVFWINIYSRDIVKVIKSTFNTKIELSGFEFGSFFMLQSKTFHHSTVLVIQCDCIDKTALLSVCRNGEGMKVDYIEVSKTHKTHII